MWKRPSISTYLISMNMVLLGLLFPLFSYLFMQKMIALQDIQLERNITTIRQSLATSSASLVRSTALSANEALAGFDFTFLQNLLSEVSHDDPEIQSCMVVDRKQTVVAHSDKTRIGSILKNPTDTRIAKLLASKFPETAQPDTGGIERGPRVEIIWPESTENEAAMTAAFPLYSGSTLWGTIRCDHSMAEVNTQTTQAKKEWAKQLQQGKHFFFGLLILFLSAGFVIAVILTRSFVRSTQILHTGVQQVAGGDFEREIPTRGVVCEEFVGLVSAFNIMTQRLRDNQRQLEEYSRSLEEKVLQRTQDLQEAQRILVQQAHEAGLAEMAVGVLHNIGNAITPAQVAANILSNQLAASPLRQRLEQSLTPLRDFLEGTRDLSPQEQQTYGELIRHLPASLREEYDRTITELNEICDKHHHIETIIKLQMRYAKISDQTGLVNVASLAQDAINITANDIAKRKITVTMNLEETPPIRAEETKLLQVMVNLIKNSYEAMDAHPDGKREITISTGVRDGEPPSVLFSVKDNGCGFSPEDKTKIFTYGYSTKKRGSGFGLHSCANTILANHGSLEALSRGQGQGAEFSILLPLEDIEKRKAMQ